MPGGIGGSEGGAMIRRCYCIFEGGGAKGIAHLGALAALEESPLELTGFAGTSAGAMVAALAAAGYRSNELLSQRGSILDRLMIGRPGRQRPVGTAPRLLGRGGWQGVRAIRFLGARRWLLPLVALVLLVLVPALIELRDDAAFLPLAIVWLSLALLLVAAGYVLTGLARLDTLRAAFQQALSLKLHGVPDGPEVTFETMRERGLPPLKIVATDVSCRQMALFSTRTTPDCAVADAVAASICLPVVFKPWRIGERLYFDGGLVSNLPAWTFDAERALDRDAATAAIQIADEPAQAVSGGIGALISAARTAVFGGDMLNKRNVDRLHVMRLKVGLGLLDFDLTRGEALRVIESARVATRAKLVGALVDRQITVAALLERLRVEAHRFIMLAVGDADAGHLRASIFLPEMAAGETQALSLRNRFSVGFDGHADERIRLPIDDSFVGGVYGRGTPFLALRSDSEGWRTSLAKTQHRWLRALVWPDLAWSLCIPFDREDGAERIVFALDGDTLPDLPDGQREPLFDLVTDTIVAILQESLPRDLDHDDLQD